MTIHDVLICLYRSPLSSIVDMLNYAIYAERADKSGLLIINTGFTVTIQTGTTFELLYDLPNHSLIYQPNKVFDLPAICGLECYSDRGRFIDAYFNNQLIDKVVFDDSAYSTLQTTQNEIDLNQFIHTFDIIDEQENIIDSFDLHGHLPESIYYFGSVFKVEDYDFQEDDYDE